eukprot:8195047-Pyramimonas_sp.AAC.1
MRKEVVSRGNYDGIFVYRPNYLETNPWLAVEPTITRGRSAAQYQILVGFLLQNCWFTVFTQLLQRQHEAQGSLGPACRMQHGRR